MCMQGNTKANTQPLGKCDNKPHTHCNTLSHTLQDAKGGNMEEKFYTKKEIAEKLDVHLNTVDSWIAKGWLPVHKIGGRVRIYESDLDAFLKRND